MMRWLPMMLLACAPKPTAPAAMPAPPQVVVVPAPDPPSHTDPVAGMLAAASVVVGMPRERQLEEIERWRRSLERTDQASDRLRLALLFTLGDPTVRDPERVRELLRGRAWHANDASYELLARMLLEVVETRTEGEEQRLMLAMALDTARQERDELQQQLEALKALDAEIDRRTPAPEKPDGTRPGG